MADGLGMQGESNIVDINALFGTVSKPDGADKHRPLAGLGRDPCTTGSGGRGARSPSP